MGFSNGVRTNVLIKCKRHCCLCGRYAGTGMELHHIIQKADGGNDSEDNCIPLCFNCHAEVKSYNPHHPKGLKYDEKELKLRRNQFYELVKNKMINCNLAIEDIDKAKTLLRNYHQIIEYIIEIDPCAQPVRISMIDSANEMILDLQKYEYTFMNEDIDRAKCKLIDALIEWYSLFNERNFHAINLCSLYFNSNSVNSFRETMYNARIELRDAYWTIRTSSLCRIP